ncbi:hypothetical protein LOTGIDRAFT_231232 [Lottia gigantea]|uniref:Band 7 domain-containing protein n=1 Tax=Lottia gigantea TaxID=225164 RepID=V4AV91_LOTGI|nr:hypothetical protein LOTGIDRAFT_231232 [Lottia gigantea]ESO98885.1 hypothetical protein LOTGIDRAFT_231232 [Lottia gigantea]
MTVGWQILEVGDQALIYSHDGIARIEDGPKRLFLWREKFQKLRKYSASQNQYLSLHYRNGQVEHVRGPEFRFLNPITYTDIKIKECTSLDANEAVVVYKQDESTTNRYVLYGPTLFMPAANEWLHEFVWHGTDPKSKTNMIPNADRFTKLKIIPDQFYYNVDEVRTADDALIRVKLMMFYELVDVDLMLNSTKDPKADFINCLCADVVAFASKQTYINFINTSDLLNELKTYPQLLERCKAIGYSVTKVVFRGYFTHDKLQKMHDWAIGKRTDLKLKFEEEKQNQELIDIKLQNEMDRIKQEQSMEISALEHQHDLELSNHIHSLELEKKLHEEKLSKYKQETIAELTYKNNQKIKEVNHVQQLSKLGVDLTQYLTSQKSRPNSITNIIATDNNTPVLHLHQNN